MILFRPHMIGALMTDPVSMDMSLLNDDEQAIYRKKNRTDAEKAMVEEFWSRGLSKGAKTELTKIAREMLYSYHKEVTSKEMEKGIRCEPDSISLLNQVTFKRYTKHEGRVQDDLFSGECDILVPGIETLDIKTSWSVDTFPVLSEDCHDSMYEWQGRAYMRLYKVKKHTVAFCLVSTPEDLVPRWEQIELHRVDHIDPNLRVTKITYHYDEKLEAKMVRKCTAAREYLGQVIDRIVKEHDL